MHGINGDLEAGLRIAPTLHRAGLPSLLITYREDLGAPASPDGLHHMGLTEWRDLQPRPATRSPTAPATWSWSATRWAARSSTSSWSARRSRPTSPDSSSTRRRLTGRRSSSSTPPRWACRGFAADPVEWMIGARIDADWTSLDALSHPEDFHLPILLFHGTEDKTRADRDQQRFAAELPGWVTYYRVPRAGHTEAWNVDPGLYEQRLTAFLRHTGT